MPTKRNPRPSATMTNRQMSEGFVDYVVATLYTCWEELQVNPKKRKAFITRMEDTMAEMSVDQVLAMLGTVGTALKVPKTTVNENSGTIINVKSDPMALNKLQLPMLEGRVIEGDEDVSED